MKICVLRDFPCVGRHLKMVFGHGQVQSQLLVPGVEWEGLTVRRFSCIFVLSHIDGQRNPNYVAVSKVYLKP